MGHMAQNAVTMHEFEYLTPGEVQRPRCHPLTLDEFESVRAFIAKNCDPTSESPLELMRLCSPPGIGEAICALNYVGTIELDDGCQIEILPKVDIIDGDDDEIRNLFLRMVSSLGESVSFKALGATHLSSQHMALFDLFVAMFLDEASRLVREGLCSAYAESRSAECFVKGRIDFQRQIRDSQVHAEKIHTIHDEFVRDRPENRLVKTTIVHLRKISRSMENVRHASRLLPAFDGISLSHNIDADFEKCMQGRSTRCYYPLLEWCRIFLHNESFTTFQGRHVAWALLFPMERVFEAYVGQELRRVARVAYGRTVQKVDLQAQTQWLFDDHQVRLRPDVIVELSGGGRVVLDTKWKRISSCQDVSVADMYQMYAYGQRYREEGEDVQHVILLYPWHRGGPEPGELTRGRHTSPDGVQVDMFLVDLSHMCESMQLLLETVIGYCGGSPV